MGPSSWYKHPGYTNHVSVLPLPKRRIPLPIDRHHSSILPIPLRRHVAIDTAEPPPQQPPPPATQQTSTSPTGPRHPPVVAPSGPHGELLREEREGRDEDQGTVELAERWACFPASSIHCDTLTRTRSLRPRNQSMSNTSSSRHMQAKRASLRSSAPLPTGCATRLGQSSSRA